MFQNHSFYLTFKPRLGKQNGGCVSKPHFILHFYTQIGQKKWRVRFKTTIFITLLEPDCSKIWRVRFKTTVFTTRLHPDWLKQLVGAFQNHSFYHTFRPRLVKKRWRERLQFRIHWICIKLWCGPSLSTVGRGQHIMPSSRKIGPCGVKTGQQKCE